MVNRFAVVVLEGEGYGDEVTIGYEGVEFYVGYFFEHIFAFECIIAQVDFIGTNHLILYLYKKTPYRSRDAFIGSVF